MARVLFIALLAGIFCSGCAGPKNFRVTEVSPGIFVGAEPRKKTDFKVLQQHNVHTVLSLECLPWTIARERERVKKRGMEFRHVFIPASPVEPEERRVKQALLILHDSSQRPIYVHCYLGHDRAALIVALYRIYYEGWAVDDAWAGARHAGLKIAWPLRGLKDYFWEHTQTPEWAKADGPAKTFNNQHSTLHAQSQSVPH
jgi:protein tyrosine phosphatase (PTP) superfamily phosphohydrolase (DUF442 family)